MNNKKFQKKKLIKAMEGDQDVLETGKSELFCPDNQAKQNTLEMKAVHLRVILEKDYKAADLKWSLFVAAAHSYRFDSCLRPFPPKFIKDGNKDMDELLSVIGDVPVLDLLLKQLDDLDNLVHIAHIVDLLFWVLVRLNEQSLKSVPYDAHESIFKIVNSTGIAEKPQHIFQVVPSSKIAAETKWQELAKNQKTFYAYHGSRLENFHSILFFGLQQHLNKNALFGNGIYLSSERSVSLTYSHDGFGWGASCLGGHLACMAVCEVIDAPDGINYHKPTKAEGEGVGEPGRTREQGRKPGSSVGTSTDIPHTYYIVTNNDLVRVRYLLVYTKSGSVRRDTTAEAATPNSDGSVTGWFGRHKLFSMLLSYGIMLVTIGFANNQPVQYYYKTLMKKIGTAINNIGI